MSGINHLYDIYKKKGDNFLNELFNKKVTVNEKMDGSIFSFEKTPSGKFLFYKRDQRRPITLVDRTLMKYYEKPIQYIESLPQHVVDRIPTGWRFGTEYFSSNQPQEIRYDELPKNNMILSYIHKRDKNGNIIESVDEKDKLDVWADVIGISRPSIIFQGKLNQKQMDQIMEFVNTPLSDLVQEFQTKSFVRYILGVLDPKMERSTLNQDLDKPIEGIVFRFGDSNNDAVVAKMIDPVFTELAKGREPIERSKKPNDLLSIVVLDVMNFILHKGIKSFELSGSTDDERYINFISDVFVKFLEKYSDRYQGMDFNEPDHLRKDEFRLNSPMLKSRAARKWLEEDDSFESLFKLILNSLRKIRKKPGGIVSSDMIEQFNILVKDIENYVRIPEKKILESEDSEITDFLSFKKKYITEKIDYLTEDEDDNSSMDKFIDAIETQEVMKPSEISKKSENSFEKVNIVSGKFQPFDNIDLKMIKELKESNGLKTLIFIVHPGYNHNGEYPFSFENNSLMISDVLTDAGIDHEISKTSKPFLTNILEETYKKNYNPQYVSADKLASDDVLKQLEYFKKTYSLPDGMQFPEIKEFSVPDRDESLINLIKNGDFTSFKKLVPDVISSRYYEVLRDSFAPVN